MRKFYAATFKAITTLAVIFVVLLFNTASAQSVLPAYLTHSTGGTTSLPKGWTINSAAPTTTPNILGLDCGGNSFNLNSSGASVTVNFNSGATNFQFYLNINSTSFSKTLVVEESANGSAWTTAATYIQSSGSGLKTGTLLSTSRYVRWRVSALSFGSFDIDGMQVYNTTPYNCYCSSTSTSTSTNFEYISGISSGTFANNSDRSNYANYISNGIINSVAQGTSFTITVNVTKYAPSGDKVYVFADWNQNGDFVDPGEASGTANVSSGTTVVTVTVPADASIGNTTLRIKMRYTAGGISMNAAPCQANFTYGEVEDYLINVYTAATITTGTIDPLLYCAGSTVAVPFSTSGTFGGGNTFTAQLSNASGLFTSPTNIGTGSSPINATIPAATASGTGYRIRVVSSSPAVNGTDNGADITINALPAAPSGSATQAFCSSSNPAVADLAASGGTIKWYSVATGGASLAPATPLVDGTSYYASQTNGSGCESSARLKVTAIVSTPLTLVSYGTNPVIYCAGAGIAPNNPTVAGGTAISYSVSPALPGGLSLNTTTGIISGTPSATNGVPATDYTVTATNICGSVSVPVNITISPAAPSALTYASNTPIYCAGSSIPNNSPSNSGGATTSYSVSPALPNGLSLDPVTGIISGTPTATVSGTYRVTAGNSCGTTFKDLVITITSPPTGISYGANPAVYCAGAAIAPNNPTVTGGPATLYSAGSLPAGLAINAATGVISGTPTATAGMAAADYTITASNDCGSVTVPVNITISPAAPFALTYTVLTANYCVGAPITSNNPSNSGGAATSYSVSPALPTGLSLDPATGIISGTPTATGSATYTVTATNSCGSTSKGLQITITSPPTGISYGTNPVVYCAGVAIAPNSPTITGGAATLYSATSLPAGLAINPATGVISGTPTATNGVPATDYTVTASNTCGSVTIPVNITISPAAPTALNYSLTPAVYCVGTTIAPNNPSNTGGAPTSYSITPALPGGLTLNPATGVISGTPGAASASQNYTVTATNSCGLITKVINIAVTTTPSITYSVNPAVYCAGVAITNNTPANTGGAVTSYSISPALPAGLIFNTSTGIISGTPTTTNGVAAKDYVVTANSTCGSVTIPVNITISPAAPTALNYSLTPAVYCVGANIAPNNPSNTGGAPTSYSITPALPGGLTLNPATGVISGTPGAASASQNYTVTATNSCGLITKVINIAVTTTPSITYSVNPAVYCAGVAITNNTPANTGGAVTSYSISPALPAGLIFNTATGIISGTPTTTTGVAAKDYVVTANSSCGSVAIPVNITISPAAPTALNYSLTPAVYCVGANITPNNPSNSGGAPTSYSITPALPAGLNFNTTTGIISGTPTTVSGSTNYTVTAINSCGSTTKVINIAVTTTPSITYATNPAVYCAGVAITNNTPANTGGAVTSYSISPALPAGLSFSTTTGIISGTPTTTNGVAAKDYVVTANSNCGSVTTPVNITISPAKPASLNYTATTVSYCINVPISPNNPSYTGGAPTSYTISPSLPAGLAINAATGVISGTPTVSAATTTYTVTASNSCGSSAKGITITVNDNATIALSSAPGTDNQTKCIGTAITNITYAIGGLGNNSATVSGALPTGVTGSYSAGVFTIKGTPTQSGIFNYTVTTTGPCTNVSLPGTITVSQNATISLTSGSASANQSLCAGLPITNITYSIGGSGTGATVTGLPSGLTTNFAGGLFTISGVPGQLGTFNYTVTASGPCARPSLSGTITTLAAPTGALSASATTVCAGQPVIFTFSNATYGSYIFKLNGVGAPLQTGTSNVYSTTTLNDGDFITVDVANSNNCGATITSAPITIKQLPAASLTPDKPSPVCEGDNVTFTALPTGVNFNYIFKVDGVAAQSGTSNTFSTSVLNDGQAVTVDVTNATGCTGVSAPITYTITPLPNGTLTATTATSVCPNSDVSFNATGGASYQFMIDGTVVQGWSSASTFTHNFTDDGVVSVSVANGPNGTGCSKTYSPGIPVTVNPLPTGTISVTENSGTLNNNVICQGSPVTYTFSNTGYASYDFRINGGTKQNSSSNVFTTTLLASSSDVVTVVVTNGSGCVQTFTAPNVIIVTSPAATLTVDPKNTICVGDNAMFTSTPLDATFTYNFKVNGVSKQSSVGNNIFSTSTLLAGTYPVTVEVTNSSSCATTSNAITMTVSALPTGTMTVGETSGITDNDGIICTGGSVTFTAPASFTNYNFLLNGVSVQDGSSRTYTVDTLTKNATVTVAVTNAAGCVAVLNSIAITVNPLPAVAAIQGPDNVCKGGSITLTDATNSPAGVWSSGNTGVATVDAATGVVTGVTPGMVTINYTYTNSNGCGSIVNKQITVNAPPVVAVITGNFNVCNGYTSQLSDATLGGVWSSGSTDVATIDASTGVVTGVAVGNSVISYTYTDANGCSATVTATVTVTDLPTVAAITTTSPSGFNVCVGGTLPLKDATTGGTWSTSDNGTATVNASGIVTGVASGQVDITYTITTSCGENATATQTITVNAPPSATISYGGSPYCTDGGNIPVTQTGTTGGSYSISPATGGVSIDPATGTIAPGTTGGNYTVTYTVAASGGCAIYKTTANVTITTAPAATIAYTGPYCTTLTSAAVTRTGTTGGTYSYTGPGTLAINATNGTINPSGSDPGDYVVTYTVNAAGCAPFSTTATVTITQAPSGTFSYNGSPYCTTSGAVNIVNSGLTPNGTFTAAPNGLTLDAATGTITPATSTGGTYIVTYKILGSGGCSDFITTSSVTITAAPTAVAGTAIQTCANSGNVNITAGASANNYSNITWTSSGTGNLSNANSLTTATYNPSAADITAGSVTITLTVSGNANCSAVSSSKLLTIVAPPAAFSITPASATICLGTIQPLSASVGGTSNKSVSNSNNTSYPIPDAQLFGGPGSVSSSIPISGVPGGAVITGITVKLNATHGYDNDLVFNLKAPNGKVLNLIDQRGGSGDNFSNTTISSGSSNPFTSNGAPFSNTYKADAHNGVGAPDQSNVAIFNSLYGTVNGNWALEAADVTFCHGFLCLGGTNTGTLNNWTLTITYTISSTPLSVTWSPATNLFTDPDASTPYTLGTVASTVYAQPSTTGDVTYTATATNSAGCSTAEDVKITSNPTPVVTIIADYCSVPNKVHLTAQSTPAATSYRWSTGETTQSIDVDVSGDFGVTAFTSLSCPGSATISVARELVTNGDFEDGDDNSFSTLYISHTGSFYNGSGTSGLWPEGYYAVDTSAFSPRNGVGYHTSFHGRDHTTGHGNFMMVNGSKELRVIWQQTVAVLPNTTYYFSAWGMNLNPTSPARLRFAVNDFETGTIGDLNTAPKPTSESQVNLGNWIRFYGTWTSGPTTTSAVINIVNLNTDAGGNDFGIDDISFGTLSTFITLESAPGTDAQTVCKNSAIANIVYNVGNGSVTPPTVTGLPAGVTTNFAGNTLTFSGTPTVAGTYSYTITTATTAGCAPASATGTITVLEDSIKLTSGSAAPVCKDVAMPSLVYTVGGTATGASITVGTLPTGVTGLYDPATKTFTISGTPTAAAGAYNYTVTTSGGNCPGTAASRTGTITIQAQSITLTSAAATNNQTKCINTAITNIQYTVTGTGTGATVSGLPNGVTGQYQSGIFTIKGTPAQAGTFNYEVTTSGNCKAVTAQGTITVTPAATIALTSGLGTEAQTICTGVAIMPIVYSVSNATGASIIAGAYPAGITGVYDATAGTYTISGIPTETVGKVFNYTVGTSGGCASDNKTGSITVTAQTVALSNGNASQTVCQSADMSPIVYTISGLAQGATVEGLPNGMSGALSNGNTTLTITGSTADPAGTYTYTVRTTGSQCGEATATGTITISAAAVGGTVTGNTTCSGGSGTLTLLGNSTNPIRWESSITNNAPWTTIANTTVTLNYSNVTVGTYYRAVVGNACGNVYSDTAYVGVHNLWTGATNTDWNIASNWSDGKVPSASCPDVYIPGGTPNQPTLSSGIATVINLHIHGDGFLTVSNATMQIGGIIDNTGTLDATNGTLEFNGTSSQIIDGATFNNRAIANLVVSNNDLKIVNTVNDTLNITGLISFGTGTAKLNTGDNLTLRSTKDNTASIGELGVNNAVSGQVEVERYINIGATPGTHVKTWQFLATPTIGQTLKQSWMENGSTVSTGYGAQFTGTTVTTGYDAQSVAPSVKSWDPAIGNWKEFPNTNNVLFDTTGYFAFVRGDRSVNGTTVTTSKPTTLRSKGTILSGDQSRTAPIQTPDNTFFSIGNPYPSAVDMTKVQATVNGSSGPLPFLYVWNPGKSDGYYYVGAWNTYVLQGGHYMPVPDDGSGSDILESGQAFLIQADQSYPTKVTFKENYKVPSGLTRPFREQTAMGNTAQLVTNLLTVKADGSTFLADGTLQQFDKSYTGRIDRYDARKITNTANNISVKTSGVNLIVERRAPLTEQDTIHYNMSSMAKQNFRLEFKAKGLSSEGVEGFVEDNFLNTRTPLNMEGTTNVDFAVTSDKNSYAANRFRIVFKTVVVLPVKLVSVTAAQKDASIEVDWKTENETSVKQYDVEKSIDGVSFKKAYTVAAENNGAGSYQWLDEQATPGYNYYRIRIEEQSGKVSYSDVVKVLIPLGKPSIGIYPNPITDGIIHLQLVNQPQGRYGIRLLNPLGQTIIAKQIEHAGGNATENIKWNYNLAHGVYQLEVLKPGGKIQVIKVIY